MLDEARKSQIFLEESYRREVQDRIEALRPAKKRSEKLWEVANSGVFIWFLSSVVLSAVSWLYTERQADNERVRQATASRLAIEEQNRRTVSRLDAEIASRLSYLGGLLEPKMKMGSSYSVVVSKEQRSRNVAEMILAVERPADVAYPVSIFPEYANRNLRSLLWGLMQVVPVSEKAEIRRLYEKYADVQALYVSALSIEPALFGAAVSSTDLQGELMKDFSYNSLKEIFLNFDLKRWGNPLMQLSKKEFTLTRSGNPKSTFKDGDRPSTNGAETK